MNTVETIRDMNKVRDMQNYLKARSERNYVMFVFQLYIPIRISDILKLKVRDVRGKNHIYKREQKTGKEQRFIINNEIKKIIDNYIQGKEDYEFLFKSQKGTNKAIERERAYSILREAGEAVGIPGVGAHTPRKTFGYFHYLKYHDLVALKEIFNHSDISVTRRYIGLNQDIKDKQVMSMSFI